MSDWTRKQVADLIAGVEHGEEKLHNMLLELSAASSAVRSLARSPQAVWFITGFTEEQRTQRAAIVSIAAKIQEGHRDQWLADLLNTFNVPNAGR